MDASPPHGPRRWSRACATVIVRVGIAIVMLAMLAWPVRESRARESVFVDGDGVLHWAMHRYADASGCGFPGPRVPRRVSSRAFWSPAPDGYTVDGMRRAEMVIVHVHSLLIDDRCLGSWCD